MLLHMCGGAHQQPPVRTARLARKPVEIGLPGLIPAGFLGRCGFPRHIPTDGFANIAVGTPSAFFPAFRSELSLIGVTSFHGWPYCFLVSTRQHPLNWP